ncbi:MAG: D-alanyl-D-alanine carboxypeptidase family protein [Oscillospiraceae bacterium]
MISLLLLIILSCSVFAENVWAEGFTYEFEEPAHCKSLFMVSMDTGKVVYEKNPDEQLPIASLTKIMTYIVAYENIPDIENTRITVGNSVAEILAATGSSLSGVQTGETFTGLQLLNLMMIPSGNDAALTLCQYVDTIKGAKLTDSFEKQSTNMVGSAFVKLMNDKAQELGCSNTHFTNPHGLHNPEHYSTARDMATIARYATTLPYFTEITGSENYTLPPTNKSSEERTVYTTNRMFSQYEDDGSYYYSKTKGIKTGSLDEAGYCIAASAQSEGYSYIVIALGSPMITAQGETIEEHGEMLDAATLFEWAFTGIENKTIATKGDLLGDIKLQYAWNKDHLQLVAEDNVQALLPVDVSISSVIVSVDLPEKVQAPVKKGDIIGTASFSYAEESIAKINIVAAESVERSELVQTVEVGKEVITSPVFLVIAGIIVVILALYFTSIFVYNHKKKKMRRVKKYRNL